MSLPQKLLIQMSGAPGSGKTTLAKLLAKAIDAIIIDHDLLKTFFLESEMPFGQSGKLAYCFQWVLAEELIRQGRSVIVDSTCNYQETLDSGVALAQKHGYDYRYIECRVGVDDIPLLDQRLRKRVPLRSQRTGVERPPCDSGHTSGGVDYHALFERWIESPYRPDGETIVVHSSINTPEHCLDYILEKMLPSTALELIE
jgi:predicted kinase